MPVNGLVLLMPGQPERTLQALFSRPLFLLGAEVLLGLFLVLGLEIKPHFLLELGQGVVLVFKACFVVAERRVDL